MEDVTRESIPIYVNLRSGLLVPSRGDCVGNSPQNVPDQANCPPGLVPVVPEDLYLPDVRDRNVYLGGSDSADKPSILYMSVHQGPCVSLERLNLDLLFERRAVSQRGRPGLELETLTAHERSAASGDNRHSKFSHCRLVIGCNHNTIDRGQSSYVNRRSR